MRLARLTADRGWTCAAAATTFMVSARTVTKWAARYSADGIAGMTDRGLRPHGSPTRTPPKVVRTIVPLRWRRTGSALKPRSRVSSVRLCALKTVLVRAGDDRTPFWHGWHG
ncbi:helix-turn-helix domain-containing protein [Haloechinothrix sp. YIM 98757]|uniref:Helix-turn-helix domain-containing protein n=1 Tax=Haloechinothrix aidingensis TaxID=2752311 RepID=A0A838AG08_9PSEU|nr:helix-turn-helix domain-containing protein [Haloechinothrix aidingensis]